MSNAQNFNPLILPLQGISLIEASAGTGKTYTLVVIYLRLLLGLGGKVAYPRPLCVKEILVVTFTETATKELRGRIRENIHQLRLACIRGHSEDPLQVALLGQLSDIELAVSRLLEAERQMDEAAIFTIHGFCQRVLTYNALESNVLFQQTLLEDESSLRQQVITDFWRRHCYPLPARVARKVQQYWEGPESLLLELLPYLQAEPPEICNPPDMKESIIAHHEHIIQCINELKQQWILAEHELRLLLDAHSLDRRVYSSKNLSVWLEKLRQWSKESTEEYHVPKELKRFKSSVLAKNTIKGKPPRHLLFEAVEEYYQRALSLRQLIFIRALDEMRQGLEQEKHFRGEMGFDDLLNRFDKALASNNGEMLARSVRHRYPVAMIDEFQDTDPQQYRIFRRLYNMQFACGLLLIGDPKQAIYAFRGADIFTYMRARREINTQYSLNTNWRSSPAMVNAVNQLFQCLSVPFIFKEIPFSPVVPAVRNAGMRFVVHQKPQPAICFWLQPGETVGVADYKKVMARQCATTVCNWLKFAQDGNAWLENKQGRQPLQGSDITILVRNRREAALMRDELAALDIPTVYLSSRESVFETSEAYELLWLLQAALRPEQDNVLRCALATSLLGFDAAAIEALNTDEKSWEQWIEEFIDYRLCWQQSGVLPMLQQMMKRHCVAEGLLATSRGVRRLTNVLHLGELLQEASVQLKNEYALVRWLKQKIKVPNPQEVNQQLRLESDHHLVQIITVHKSKGMEFPLVCLPFIADFRQQKRPLFHDRQEYHAWLDLTAMPKSLKLAEEERLAEDIRLFYVAVTRSMYHCSIGLAPLSRGNRKKNGNSDLHLSAPGYLIQKGKAGDAGLLRRRLEALLRCSGGHIVFCFTSDLQVLPLISPAIPDQPLAARYWENPIQDPWRVISYTDLQRQGSSMVMEPQPRLDMNSKRENCQKENMQLTPHTFPRGVFSGVFLHNLFEILDFTQLLDSQWLGIHLIQNGIDEVWLPTLQEWISAVIHTPLDGEGLSLSRLSFNSRLAELQFYLPINTILVAQDVEELCKKYDSLSARCQPLLFPKVKGMLKGFIDLVFRWKGRYYLLDYKSNWLGENSSAYTQAAMEQVMIAHRYELQYQFYTLALHRFLRHRLVHYDYQQDFGGVFYFFLRGVDAPRCGNGVYSCRPDMALIDGLDRLFSGNSINVRSF